MKKRDIPVKELLVVEDDYFMRTSLCGYLTHKGYNVATASHATEAVKIFESQTTDVAIVDVVIPENSQDKRGSTKQSVGLNLVKRLKQTQPSMGVVILSAYEDRKDEVLNLLHTTMSGIIYQIKGSNDPTRLDEGIRMAALGYIWIDPDARITKVSEFLLNLCTPEERPIIDFALSRLDTLTSRERQILEKIGQARTTKLTAKELVIATGTVEIHVSNIHSKLFNTLAKEAGLREAILLGKVALIDRARQIEQ